MATTQLETRAQPCLGPPRYKRALLTFLGLLAPVYFIPPALTAQLPGRPFAVVVLAVASIVIVMTYLIMPALQRMFAPWLRTDDARARAAAAAAPDRLRAQRDRS